MTAYANIAESLIKTAQTMPYKRAVVYPAGRDKNNQVLYSHLTFKQLDVLSSRLAAGLESIGISRGTRTILMVPPGMEFFIIVFAMFKVGAVPVVVDPGMGIDRMVQCLHQGRPKHSSALKSPFAQTAETQIFQTNPALDHRRPPMVLGGAYPAATAVQ